ncbi:MAG: nucleotidyltransferase domain-containing protein [Peptostreptococcales bacterium]
MKKLNSFKKQLNKDNFQNILTEIISKKNINVEMLEQKDYLNPKIWDDKDKLHFEVRKSMLYNAYEFIKSLKIDDLKINDITLTGSLANYNWNEFSDIDIHILLDFTQISNNIEFISEFFRTKKSLWNDKYPITIKGFDVELYVQDINEPHTSTGVYSILNNEWNSKPIKEMVTIDINNVREKTFNFINIIDSIDKIEDENYKMKIVDQLKDKIKKYRQAGLESDLSVFSTENLVFKLLRNYGYLDKLSEYKDNIIKNKLTLEYEKI